MPVAPAPQANARSWRRICCAIAAALLLAVLPAACTITSDRPLVAPTEGAAPLPDAFTLFRYDWTADGYVPSGAIPVHFTLAGLSYVSADLPQFGGPLAVRFIPVGEGVFLVAATTGADPGTAYGFARYDEGVLALALSPDAETGKTIAAAHATAMPKQRRELAGLHIDPRTHAITVRDRLTLDTLAHMYAAGDLPLARPAVAFVAADPEAVPPARLIPNGTQWMRVP